MMIGDWAEDNLGWLLVFATGALIALVGFVAHHDAVIFDRNMSQCLADGHKEYECRALLENHQQIIPMPIVIPTGH